MFSWSVMASMVGCTVTMYLFVRYVLMSALSWPVTIILLFVLLLIGCVQPLSSYGFEEIFGKYYPLYRYIIYFLFVGCVILAVLTLTTDALWFIAYKTGLINCSSFSKDICVKVNWGLIIAALMLSLYALYEGTRIPNIKEVDIYSDKITVDKKIVVLSDIHIHRVISPSKIAQIVERTNELNPDIIILAGDVVDDSMKKIGEIVDLLGGLKAKEGVYFVSGNHEFYAGYRDSLTALKKLGFKQIENSGVDLGDVYLAGIPDWRTAQRIGLLIRLDAAFANAKAQQFKILASHTPVNFGEENNFDLQLSGHTHGGQIFPFHVLSSWHNKYLAGLYNVENEAKIYVSRGAGQWGPQMRLLAPSEITLIKLKPKRGE